MAILRLTSPHDDVTESMDYLEDGGLGEVFGFTHMALTAGEPKVQSDTAMALAMCLLASEAIQARRDAKETRQ